MVPVVVAADGMPLPRQGAVIVPPPDQHLRLADGKLRVDAGPRRHSSRPSVDVLFESVARDVGGAAIAVLLSGMGRDGAAGLLALRRAGAETVVQDEATCAVFGMPREAIRLGAASMIRPAPAIASTLLELVQTVERGARP
jgi:two-component system chemotaxis response regulator CheB